jgi:GTP cyclohydrolase IA
MMITNNDKGGIRLFDREREDLDMRRATVLHRRYVSDEQMRRFEGYAAEIFEAFGLDLSTQATEQTPKRFIQALFDATDGYDGDPKLLTTFDNEYQDEPHSRLSQVIEGPIPFFALCEHHALPFHGQAYVGYVADERIIGISKLTRLVRLFAKRFTMQERLGQQIAGAFDAMLQPYGVAVYLEAQHLCKMMRGVRETCPLTRTSTWRGEYESNSSLRVEFLLATGADL